MNYRQSAYDKLRTYKEEVKEQVFEKIFASVSLSVLDLDDTEQMRRELEEIAREEIEPIHLTYYEKQRIIDEILEDIFGYGPLESLLNNSAVSDILVNGPGEVFIDVGGTLEKTPVYFRSREHLLHIIRKLVGAAGRRIDESTPIVDAYLPDGSRVNAVIPPVVAAPSLSIRKFVASYSSLDLLVKNETLSAEMAKFLGLCVSGKLNILVSGATGSGKTTLLNALAHHIPDAERIVTVEDSMELDIQKPDLVRLVTRQPNVEGKGRITQRDLVVNSLRMRPDRIIVGEVRSSEVWDMLTAMNTGHAGSLTTVHANSASDALYRLETMSMLSGYKVSEQTLWTIISRSVDIVIHLGRFATGERKMVSISEIGLDESGRYRITDLFTFSPQGVEGGKMLGRFKPAARAVSDRLAEKVAMTGLERKALERYLEKEGA
jgi:pilus assembly protein CpaF